MNYDLVDSGHDNDVSDNDDMHRFPTRRPSPSEHAAFVICWPNEQSRPVSTSGEVKQSKIGGCIVLVWDSNLADDWLKENENHSFLVQLRNSRIGGPIPSMLSINSEALTIFGNMSVYLLKIGDKLAKLSGFPVIVKPLEEDPFPLFRNREILMAADLLRDGSDQASTKQGTNSDQTPHSTSDNPREQQGNNDYDEAGGGGGGGGEGGYGHGGGGGGGGDSGGDRPPPVHKTDICLTLLSANTPGNHFIRPITKVKLCPPNLMAEVGDRTNTRYEIEAHVDLEVLVDGSIIIDSAIGSCGFLANRLDYLNTEYLIQLGYQPRRPKVKRTVAEQRSTVSVGLFGAGGKPILSVNTTKRKIISSATSVADEVAEKWLVRRQQIFCNWNTNTSVHRGVSVMIRRDGRTDTGAPTLHVKYGIGVGVEMPIGETTARVSFLYRHQIHCWFKSNSGVRGLIMLVANFIPDVHADQPLRIEGYPTLDLNTDIQKDVDSKRKPQAVKTVNTQAGGVPCLSRLTDHVMFAAAACPPGAKGIARLRTWGKELGKNLLIRNREKAREEISPMQTSIARGQVALGWDHTNWAWYNPIWPELDEEFNFAEDGPRMKLRLDWLN